MRREQPKPLKPEHGGKTEPQKFSRKYHMPSYGWGGIEYRDPQNPVWKKKKEK